MLYNKKALIKKQHGKLNKLRQYKNKWEKIIEDAPAVQRIFFEMLNSNLDCAPQVCLKTFLLIYYTI